MMPWVELVQGAQREERRAIYLGTLAELKRRAHERALYIIYQSITLATFPEQIKEFLGGSAGEYAP